jgi:transposase
MPMGFLFYPKHEFGCEHVGHCPHLGGAALGSVVLLANQNHDDDQAQLRTIDQLREENERKYQRIVELEKEVEQLKLELKLERQNKFKKNSPDEDAASSDESTPAAEDATSEEPKKRGAPVGHPGWFRPRPETIDNTVEVSAPSRCPLCGGEVRVYEDYEADEHLQEDIIDGRRQVTCFVHPAARCRTCRRWVKQEGPGELLGKRIGPQARGMASFFRTEIGMSTRKVTQAIGGISGLTFTAAAGIGFEIELARRAGPLAEDIEKKVATSDVVHADETGWRVDGKSGEFWFHGNDCFAHFHWDKSRAGEVSRGILGDAFDGVLVTDCYAGYRRHVAGAKQKCLVHLARTAREWKPLAVAAGDSAAVQFFDDVIAWVKRGCWFHRQRRGGGLSVFEQLDEKQWLREELLRLEECELKYAKALTLQQRLLKNSDDWLVFLDNERVHPTNNLAERALRPLVVLRKLTYGSRSAAGARRVATMLTVIETCKRHGHSTLDFLYVFQTRSVGRALRWLYDSS